MTACPLPPETCERLAQLLPMLLSNPSDAMRRHAARAIERVLDEFELDWDDMVAAIAVLKPPPDDNPKTAIPGNQLAALIQEMRARCRYEPRADGFLRHLLGRAEQFDQVRLSLKQRKWLLGLMRE